MFKLTFSENFIVETIEFTQKFISNFRVTFITSLIELCESFPKFQFIKKTKSIRKIIQPRKLKILIYGHIRS